MTTSVSSSGVLTIGTNGVGSCCGARHTMPAPWRCQQTESCLGIIGISGMIVTIQFQSLSCRVTAALQDFQSAQPIELTVQLPPTALRGVSVNAPVTSQVLTTAGFLHA